MALNCASLLACVVCVTLLSLFLLDSVVLLPTLWLVTHFVFVFTHSLRCLRPLCFCPHCGLFTLLAKYSLGSLFTTFHTHHSASLCRDRVPRIIPDYKPFRKVRSYFLWCKRGAWLTVLLDCLSACNYHCAGGLTILDWLCWLTYHVAWLIVLLDWLCCTVWLSCVMTVFTCVMTLVCWP